MPDSTRPIAQDQLPGELGLPDELDAMAAELSAAAGGGGGDDDGSGATDAGSGVTAATKPAAGKRRGIVNETGVPACLELLQPAGELGAGAGVRAGPRGAIEEAWQRLAEGVDPKRTCSTFQSILWIFDNAGKSPTEIEPDEVPSLGTLMHLKLVQRSDADYGEFLKNIWSKTIPSKTEVDRGGRFFDDGRTELKLLDEFEAELKAQAEAEKAEREAANEAAQSGPGGD